MQNTTYYERRHYRFLSNNITIHVFVFLGLFAVQGYAVTLNPIFNNLRGAVVCRGNLRRVYAYKDSNREKELTPRWSANGQLGIL
jgi:hypothetical protein